MESAFTPPLENFDEIPVVTGGPYVHDKNTYIMHPSKEGIKANGATKTVNQEAAL